MEEMQIYEKQRNSLIIKMTKKTTSPRFKIYKVGLLKVGKGALISGVAVALTYLAENIGSIDFGNSTALVVGVAAVVINFLRKLLIKYQ